MTRYAITYLEQAEAAIQAQATYIAVDQQSPTNASRWLGRLRAAVAKLELMPDRHGVDAQQTAALGFEVRRLVFERTYLIYFQIDEPQQRVIVVHFRHGARLRP